MYKTVKTEKVQMDKTIYVFVIGWLRDGGVVDDANCYVMLELSIYLQPLLIYER